MKERQNFTNVIVAKTWQKQSCHHSITLRRALAVEGLTDDVKEGWRWCKKAVHALKEESKKSQLTVNLTIATIWPFKLSADDEHPADTIA